MDPNPLTTHFDNTCLTKLGMHVKAKGIADMHPVFVNDSACEQLGHD